LWRARGFAAGAGASSALLFLRPRGFAAGFGLLSELLRRARAGDAFLAAG
jgi:hypothetical protein